MFDRRGSLLSLIVSFAAFAAADSNSSISVPLLMLILLLLLLIDPLLLLMLLILNYDKKLIVAAATIDPEQANGRPHRASMLAIWIVGFAAAAISD